MGKRVLVCLLGLAAVALGCLAVGCGTVCNLAGGFTHPESLPRVYGGIQIDVEGFQKLMDDNWSFGLKNGSSGTAMFAMAVLGFCAVEPALTVVGDTLTLPIAFLADYRREAGKSSVPEAEPAPPRPIPVSLGRPVVPESTPADSADDHASQAN